MRVERGRESARKGSYNTAETKVQTLFGDKFSLFCSLIRLKRRNSKMCCRKCTGRGSRGDPKRAAAPGRRRVLICAGLRQRRRLLPPTSLTCVCVSGRRHLSEREGEVRNGQLTCASASEETTLMCLGGKGRQKRLTRK